MRKAKLGQDGELAKSAKGEFKKQLLSYSVAAGAALIGASYADAGVVYSSQDLWVNSATPSVGIDMDGVGPLEFTIQWNGMASTSISSAWSNRLKIVESGSNSIASTGWAGTTAYASKFDKSFYVGGTTGSSWESTTKQLAYAYGTGTSIWTTEASFVGVKGFIGVRFRTPANEKKFGWIEFEAADDASWGHITGWAYETEGESGESVRGDPIHVGDTGDAIPEPGGLALLATGVAGLAALRKKREE